MNTKNRKMTQSTSETLAFLEGLIGPSTFGNTLQAIRLADELTQREFASKLGISAQHLSDLENERRGVSPAKAKEFAEKLGYLPERFVQLAVQDLLAKSGLDWEVSLKRRKKSRGKKASTRRPATR